MASFSLGVTRMVRVMFRFRFSGINSSFCKCFKVGPGFRPVLPFRGRGCGRRTAGRSACPVVGATGTPLHFPLSGKFRLYPCSSSPHKGHSPLWGPHLLVWELRLPRNPRQTGANLGFFLWGGVTTLPSPEKSTNPSLRLQGWLTGAFPG